MNGSDPTVDNNDKTKMVSGKAASGLSERLWALDDFTAVQDEPAGFATGLVSLAFIRTAIRRGARFWCASAIVGLLIGLGVYAAFPPAFQASTSLLITYGPSENPGTAITNNQAIAQSHAVAELALHKLGLRQSVSSFLAAYTVTIASERVMVITVRAPSGNDAVRWASVLATSFLQFRAAQLETEQGLLLKSLDQDVTKTRQRISSVNSQIRQLSARPTPPAQKATLADLHAKLTQATINLTALQNAVASELTISQPKTMSAIKGSKVLDAAAQVPTSRAKYALIYPLTGLILGLCLGMGIVAVGALTSDRLRLRKDIAGALGTNVMVSVGRVRLSNWLLARRDLAVARRAELQRIVAHLRSSVQPSTRGAATLAVVPVDDMRIAAISLVSLAISYAQQGKQVILADLCSSTPAGSLLNTTTPGVHEVTVQGVRLTVAIPDDSDTVPVGPLHWPASTGFPASPSADRETSILTEQVTAAYASADLLLTLVALDPLLGSDHLATWATAAVATVTAGRSSATKIHSVGEMIRLAGTSLTSAVLIGADKPDESLGAMQRPGMGYVSPSMGGVAAP